MLKLQGARSKAPNLDEKKKSFLRILKASDVQVKTTRIVPVSAGLHKLWYPGIRDTSTWSKFRAHGEHGDVFLFSNLGAL